MKEFDNMNKVVEQLLHDFPITRDADRKLMARCWAQEVGGEDMLKQMTAYDFLALFATSKKLSNPATLIRCRRKIQELKPELQGKGYAKRKEKAEQTRIYFKPQK
jgi:hypothetical protein